MSEVIDSVESQQSSRARIAFERRQRLLDIAWPDGNAHEGINERPFPCSPNIIYELMVETDIGAMMIQPGNALTRGQIKGLLEPDVLGAPIMKRLPDRAFLRTARTQPLEDEPVTAWRQTVAVVFQYDQPAYYDRVVTGEMEVGLTFGGKGPVQGYRTTAIYVNGAEFMVEAPDMFDIQAVVVDQFAANVGALMATTQFMTVQGEMYAAKIDTRGLGDAFGDRIDIVAE